MQNEKNFFKIPSNLQKNVYLPTKTQQLIRLPTAASTPDDDCSFFSGILDTYTGNNKKRNKTNQLPPNVTLKCIEAPPQPETCTRKHKLVYTWENIEADDSISKSFSSESAIPIQQHLSALQLKKSVAIKTIPFEKLLNDIKLLTIGIESESFKRSPSDLLTFEMTTNLSCTDISDVTQFVEEFLVAGSCFRRLKTFTSKNPFNQSYIFDGFIFKAFADCVVKFMNNYRDIVYSQEVETLLEFSSNTKNIRKILVHLTKFLNIHPSSTYRSKLPTGSDFLGLLYNEYTTIFNHDVKCFFIECLKACCQIYFINFHKWLFHGYIDDPNKELFIYFVDHYRPNTKYFFDKAYLIRKQSVPGFLQGCAENILLCGKYTMLLKSYNQVHPLFMLHKPSLKVCLTNEEMLELRQQCSDFEKEARAACGKKISIAKILHDRQNVKNDKYKKAEDASVHNMQQWRQEQEDRRNVINEKRDLKVQGLREELKRIEEGKMVKRMAAIQVERDFLDEVEEVETRLLERENAELQRRIAVYEKLNQNVDRQVEKGEEVVVELKKTLATTGDVNEVNVATVEDTINANEPIKAQSPPAPAATDEMNNVIPIPSLTEAQRNKLKVLSHEYNFTIDDNNGNSAEAPATISKSTISERQRNKLKVMGHEFGMIDEPTAPKISVQSCENMTDLQRNRLKVLSHEYNIEKEIPTSLNLLHVQPPSQHLESPMSVTSDHFSDNTKHSSPEEVSEMEKSQVIHDDDELEMLKAFEDAVEKNHSTFMGINLNDFTVQSTLSYEHIKTTDTMALSRFLQMSLMIPVNSYMDILNNETLKMFVNDLDILSHFKSLRNYFLMMNGEFSISICQKLFSKLESGVRPVELLNYQSLHTILDHALSRSRHDNNTEQLSFIVQNIPEKFEIHSPAVLNMLTMSYKLEWPLNLILNPETMEQYQAIFNYLLKLKRISWVLEECFQLLKELHKKHGKDLLRSQQFRNVQQIRHKMTHFVHCLENHVTRNVLQISWNAFVEDLKSAQSIHGIYRKHTNYLKRVLFLCLLNKKSFEFQKTIEDSFKVILKFHK